MHARRGIRGALDYRPTEKQRERRSRCRRRCGQPSGYPGGARVQGVHGKSYNRGRAYNCISQVGSSVVGLKTITKSKRVENAQKRLKTDE